MRNRDPRFGDDTQPPTEFESALLKNSHALDDIWVAVGKQIGPESLFRLFAELGGMIVSVPTRESFVRRLYLPMRDAEILARLHAGDQACDIAKDFRVTRQTIRSASLRALKTAQRRG